MRIGEATIATDHHLANACDEMLFGMKGVSFLIRPVDSMFPADEYM